MKKLVIFHPSTELYGADRIMVLAAKASLNFEVTIFLPKKGPLVEYIKEELPTAKVEILECLPVIQRSMFSLKGIVSASNQFRRFRLFIKNDLLKQGVDLVYVNTLACTLCLPSLRMLNAKVITHVHEIIDNPKVIAKATATIAARYSSKVICVSQAVKSGILKHVKKDNEKIIVLRNGIEPIPKINPQLRNHRTEFYLFGRIKPEKGHWYLIEALKQIDHKILEKAHFNLVGGTVKGQEHLIDEIRQLLKENNLSEYVSITGFTRNITPLISAADVCLIPSLMKDPFPTTVLEAMSIGKAIITTDTGGAKEAIVNGDSGIIIPADSPEKFAQSIEECIADRNMIMTLGQNAENRFNELFTVDHFNKKWQKVVKTIFSQVGKEKPVLNQVGLQANS